MTTRTRTPQAGTFERDLEQAETDAEAARLRSTGLSYPALAKRLGCSQSTAYDRVQRAIAAAPREAGEAARALEESRLDVLWEVAWQIAHGTYRAVSQGKVLDEFDATINLQAIDRLIKIQERRAKLRGLDAPTRKIVEVITEDVIDAELRRLESELAANGVDPEA